MTPKVYLHGPPAISALRSLPDDYAFHAQLLTAKKISDKEGRLPQEVLVLLGDETNTGNGWLMSTKAHSSLTTTWLSSSLCRIQVDVIALGLEDSHECN